MSLWLAFIRKPLSRHSFCLLYEICNLLNCWLVGLCFCCLFPSSSRFLPCDRNSLTLLLYTIVKHRVDTYSTYCACLCHVHSKGNGRSVVRLLSVTASWNNIEERKEPMPRCEKTGECAPYNTQWMLRERGGGRKEKMKNSRRDHDTQILGVDLEVKMITPGRSEARSRQIRAVSQKK